MIKIKTEIKIEKRVNYSNIHIKPEYKHCGVLTERRFPKVITDTRKLFGISKTHKNY